MGWFRITPYLTDHSAFDAHMLLIEVEGKRLLYSGDFRTHGRKASLVRALMDAPPPNLDVLLMEGTSLGSDKPCAPESWLEDDFSALFTRTAGRVFVVWSAQNIDRTVTLYRACLKAGRTLVIDLYTAEVLEMLSAHGRIPQPNWKQLRVVVTSSFARMYRNTVRGEFVERMAKNGIAARALSDTPDQWGVMLRTSLMRNFIRAGTSALTARNACGTLQKLPRKARSVVQQLLSATLFCVGITINLQSANTPPSREL